MCSDEVLIWIEIILACGVMCDVIQVQFVPQKSADTSKAFAKLEAIGRLVGNELDFDAVCLVMETDPVGKLLACYDFEVNSSILVLEVLRVLLLLSIKQEDLCFVLDRVFDFVSHDFDVFKKKHGVKGSKFEGLHGVFDSENNHASVH